MKRVICLLCVSASTVLSYSGLSQQQRNPWDRLSTYDKDGDGRVTKEEFTGPDHVFTRYDLDEDSAITEEEAAKARGKGKGMTKGKGKGGKGEAKPDNAPKEGSQAPAVKVQQVGSGEMVDIASPEKISVLVFGSHT